MPPTRIVKAFDELEDRVARLGLRFEPAASQQLAFQRGKETLGHRIVVGIAYTAHRRPHTRFAAAVAELDGRVLGRFKWSSQCFMRSYDDQMEAAIGSFSESSIALARSTTSGRA